MEKQSVRQLLHSLSREGTASKSVSGRVEAVWNEQDRRSKDKTGATPSGHDDESQEATELSSGGLCEFRVRRNRSKSLNRDAARLGVLGSAMMLLARDDHLRA